jgi:hypothetical protein
MLRDESKPVFDESLKISYAFAVWEKTITW